MQIFIAEIICKFIRNKNHKQANNLWQSNKGFDNIFKWKVQRQYYYITLGVAKC